MSSYKEEHWYKFRPYIYKPAGTTSRIIKGMGMRYVRGPHKGAINLSKGSKKAKAYMQFVRSFRRKK